MAFWQHPARRTGFVGLGTRVNVGIRADGVFEAPDDPAVERRLTAAGHKKLPGDPGPCKVAVAKPLSVKQARIKARVDRRKAEAKAEARAESRTRRDANKPTPPAPAG